MLHKIQESVKLLNREYLQSFSVSPESRDTGFAGYRSVFRRTLPDRAHVFLFMGVENGKAEINGILSFSTDSLSGRPFMTGIRQASGKKQLL